MSQEVLTKKPEKVLKKITTFRNQVLFNHHLLQPSIFPKIKQIKNWEEIECLGYNPEQSRIEAIINIKKSTGYSGNLCSLGSPEYVRFFIDYNDGNGFQDLGVSSFRAFDISDTPAGPQHPISYMVSKNVDVSKHIKFCNNEVIVTLRAILSWNQLPSNDPNQTPTYGNVLDAEAVLQPFKFKFPFNPLDITIANPLLKKAIDYKSLLDKNPLELKSFVKSNLEDGVTPSRTFTQLMSLSKNNTSSFFKDFNNLNFDDLGINFDDLVLDLGSKDFNINYEELVSVGMNTQQDTLGAVINIKRKKGYGGNLCKNGSLEHVSFFGDFNNNGIFESYLGTTSVNVNDIENLPADGLKYAVFLKTDLSKYLKPCHKPQIIRIRAILSWSTPPTTNPKQQVAWGNRMDTLVQLRPKKTNQEIFIHSITDVNIEDISTSTNLAYPGTTGKGNNRPWGGMVKIRGSINNSGAAGTTKYRVEYSKNGVNYLPVTLKQRIKTFNNGIETTHDLEDPNGWFPYLEDFTDSSNITYIDDDNLLATWPSHDFEGKYYLRVSYTKDDPNSSSAAIFHSQAIKIQLDNRRYKVDATPNNTLDVAFDVDLTIDGGVCRVYNQNDQLTGKIKVRDQFYGGYNLSVQPATQVIPGPDQLIEYNDLSLTDNHDINEHGPLNEPFTLNTSRLSKCGYTLRLRGYERTILNDNHHFPRVDKYIGFSVK